MAKVIEPKRTNKLQDILVIGDLHGRRNWVKALGMPNPDTFRAAITSNAKDNLEDVFFRERITMNSIKEIVFMGDFTDSFTISHEEQIKCLEDVVLLQEKFPDRVKVIAGNHDIAYMYPSNWTYCSGFSEKYADRFKALYDRLTLTHAYGVDKYLFTHAGVSSYLVKKEPLAGRFKAALKNGYTTADVAKVINDFANECLANIDTPTKGVMLLKDTLWSAGPTRRSISITPNTLKNYTPGLIWCHFSHEELLHDSFTNHLGKGITPKVPIIQVLGHTEISRVVVREFASYPNGVSPSAKCVDMVINCDCNQYNKVMTLSLDGGGKSYGLVTEHDYFSGKSKMIDLFSNESMNTSFTNKMMIADNMDDAEDFDYGSVDTVSIDETN